MVSEQQRARAHELLLEELDLADARERTLEGVHVLDLDQRIHLLLLDTNTPAKQFAKIAYQNSQENVYTAGIILTDYSERPAGLRPDTWVKRKSTGGRPESKLDGNVREAVYKEAPPRIKITAWEKALSAHTQGTTTKGKSVDRMRLPYMTFYSETPELRMYDLERAQATYSEQAKARHPNIQDRTLTDVRVPKRIPATAYELELHMTRNLYVARIVPKNASANHA